MIASEDKQKQWSSLTFVFVTLAFTYPTFPNAPLYPTSLPNPKPTFCPHCHRFAPKPSESLPQNPGCSVPCSQNGSGFWHQFYPVEAGGPCRSSGKTAWSQRRRWLLSGEYGNWSPMSDGSRLWRLGPLLLLLWVWIARVTFNPWEFVWKSFFASTYVRNKKKTQVSP